MARGNLTFRQRDMTAAIKAVAAAGFSVVGVEVDRHGKIVVHTDRSALAAPVADSEPERNEWDEVAESEPGR